jgi:succinate dehydrogenase hydrophobic anchor subunit
MTITLGLEEFTQGITSLVFIIISLCVGVMLILKYFKSRQNTLLFAGLTWCFISSTWFTSAFNFLYFIITGTSISDEIYFLSYITPPITVFFWLNLFTSFRFIEKRKEIIVIWVIQGISYGIILIYYILTDLSVVGYKNGLFNAEFTRPFSIYFMVILIISLITGILFGLDAIKSEYKETRLKGKFIIAAFSSFCIGALLDTGIFLLTPIFLIFVRIILITSAIEFYFGFFLPDWLKKFLIKNE